MTDQWLASNEDGIDWVRADAMSRRAAIRFVRKETGAEGPLKATSVFMRPARASDEDWRCAKCYEIADDSADKPAPARCAYCGQERRAFLRSNYLREDCYQYQCKASHPDAVAAWRIEYRDRTPLWWVKARRRIFNWLYPRRSVLWGGRPDLRVRWYHRPLVSRGHVLIGGTWQALRPDYPVLPESIDNARLAAWAKRHPAAAALRRERHKALYGTEAPF